MKLSIIIPVYNVRQWLEETVNSVLNQTFRDFELILVDDGATDGSGELCDRFALADNRVRVIHQENAGVSAARNAGLDAAKGEYIGIVEPDDWIDLNMYKKLYYVAKKFNTDIVKSKFYKYLDIERIESNKKIQDILWFKKNPPNQIFKIEEYADFLYFHPSIWSAIYKSEFIKSNNIKMEELPGACWTDNLFQVQTLCLAKSIYYINTSFYYYRNRNIDDAFDLKDHTIPWLRTKSIHNWLVCKNITNQNIWSNLYKREIAYLNICVRSASFISFKKIIPLILDWQKNLNKFYFNTLILSKKEIKLLSQLTSNKNIWIYYLTYKLKKLRHLLFSLRIKKTSFLLQLVGIQISKGDVPFRKSFIKIHFK